MYWGEPFCTSPFVQYPRLLLHFPQEESKCSNGRKLLVPPLESLLSKLMESTEEHGSRSLCETQVEGVSSGSEADTLDTPARCCAQVEREDSGAYSWDKSVCWSNKSLFLCILALYIASHSDLFHPDND